MNKIYIRNIADDSVVDEIVVKRIDDNYIDRLITELSMQIDNLNHYIDYDDILDSEVELRDKSCKLDDEY